jgi:hypothetical protein
MTDLPQNELFSAYLDGELTAAEQAEMEQLLATSPAARQLLDELRALSATLQNLPREGIGEDLSRQVLRVAERRMLTEGGPGDAETAPMPPGRSRFQRFATRRNLVWLALTASIAVMVLIDEHRQAAKPVQVARQTAVAKRAREPGPPPTIQAAHDVVADAPERADVRAKEKSDRETSTEPSVARNDRPAESSLRREPAGGSVPAAASPPPQPAFAGALKGAAEREPVHPERGAMTAKAVQKDIGAEHDESSAEVEESLLVVHCDISPKAVANQAFDKLLDANGIAQNQQHAQIGGDDKAKQNRAEDAKQQATGTKLPAQSDGTGNASFVYVEATPAQIAATLAGLAAQPDVFLAVSLKPAEDEQSQAMVRRYVARDQAVRNEASGLGGQIQSKVAIRSARSAAAAGKPAAAPENRPATLGAAAMPAPEPLPQSAALTEVKAESMPDEEAAVAEKQPSFSATEVPDREAKPAKVLRQLQKPSQTQQQLAPSALRQRVLFVVRVVDGDQPPSAAKSPVGVEADSVAPVKAANDPASKEIAPPAGSPARDK